jgi:hypothetical protein
MNRDELVRVMCMFPWPGSHADINHHPVSTTVKRPKKLGEIVFSIGIPVTPSSGWHCGTDLCWPVYEINGKAVVPDNRGRLPYVCRHQFIAGD